METAFRALTAGPARAFGLEKRLPGIGTLDRGVAGDLVLLDPSARWVVDATRMKSKGKNTPLTGQELVGEVRAVMIGGSLVFERGQVHA